MKGLSYIYKRPFIYSYIEVNNYPFEYKKSD